MKALVYEGIENLQFKDVPEPEVQEGEQLVRIAACGICGSDMHAYLGHDARRPAPLILGHEAAGVIVNGPKAGTRVTINPLVTDDSSHASLIGRDNLCENRQIISMPPREGAFAQFLAMPETNLIPVPDDISLEKAALAEPMAVSWHTVRLALEALHPKMECRALVIGGGAIGIGAALAFQAKGVEDVTILEPNENRRAFLIENCGQVATDKAEHTPTIVIDAVGYSSTRAKASAVVEPGGVIAHVGLGEDAGGLDIRRMTLQEITFIGTYTYTKQDFFDTTKALFDGSLGPLDWAEKRGLSDGAQAFQDIRSGAVPAPKIILNPWS